MTARRYTALGWVAWKIMGRVARRKAARNRARLTAVGGVLAVLAAGVAAAAAKRSSE
jgi:hypothetical protein